MPALYLVPVCITSGNLGKVQRGWAIPVFKGETEEHGKAIRVLKGWALESETSEGWWMGLPTPQCVEVGDSNSQAPLS